MCVRVTRSLSTLQAKYPQSNVLISAITSECLVTAIAALQVEGIIKQGAEGLASRLDPQSSQLSPSLELALSSFSNTLVILDGEVQKAIDVDQLGRLGWKSKTKYDNEEHANHSSWSAKCAASFGIRNSNFNLCQSVSVIMTLIQVKGVDFWSSTDPAGQHRCTAKDGTETANFKQSRAMSATASATVSTVESAEFSFDDQIISR